MQRKKLTKVVVKPLESAGSQGVTICNDLDEMISAINNLLTLNDVFGRRISSCLVQERIVGTEYMVDEKGPVLIEVNCKPMGNSFPAEYLDLCTGQHETDSILDAYLDPELFERKAAAPYRPYCGMRTKFIMVPKSMETEAVPLWEIAKHFRSTYKVVALADGSTHLSDCHE